MHFGCVVDKVPVVIRACIVCMVYATWDMMELLIDRLIRLDESVHHMWGPFHG